MNLPKRKQIRLPEYDYSASGAYFVTICTRDRRCILSEIAVGDGVLDVPNVRLSPYGEILAETLREIERTYSWLSLDRYVISEQFFGWLLGFGDKVTIMGPDSAIAAFTEYLDKVRGLY